jgi:hypothetical protein
VYPEDKEMVKNAADKIAQTAETDEWKFRMVKKDGSIIYIRGTGRIINTNTEKLLVGTLQDVTADVLLKQTLQTKNLELERSNEDLQQFAHVASHDLKEPVRKVRTFGSRLEQEFKNELPEKAKLYVQKMQNAAERIYSMIDGVLQYSSVNSIDQDVEKVDLNDIFRNIETDLEILIQQKEATIEYKELPVLEGFPILLHQLFYNLINNSLKFSKSDVKPRIQILSEKVKGQTLKNKGLTEKEYIKISVIDNGIGFEQAQVIKIFKTFARLNSKDMYEGTGLGLALCKKIVERHQGNIEGEGKAGDGAIFTILLPAKKPV